MPPSAGLDEVASEPNPLVGGARASHAGGHPITTGFPRELPPWALSIQRKAHDWPRTVRRGAGQGWSSRVNWRQTLKRWGRRGHSDGGLVLQKRPHGPGKVVILWDISGSMAEYVGWFFPWIFQLTRQREVACYAFGTTLKDLTDLLNAPYAKAVRQIYDQTALWGSGTAIGEMFELWLKMFGAKWLGTWTSIVIISDGWDVGPVHLLESSLKRLAAESRHILWVNPLMVTPGFEAKTRALKVARRYTGTMTSGASVTELQKLTWRLGFEV